METVNSKERLNYYLDACGIRDKFSSCHPAMYLFHYYPGEFLTSPFSPAEYLQFIVDGELKLYDMPSESSTTNLQTPNHTVSFLGDAELMDAQFVPFFIEANTEVYTIAIPLERYREELLNDNTFLRFVCATLAAKLCNAVSDADKRSLREQLLLYLSSHKPEQPLRSISQLSQLFNVSSRQMLRVLKGLCADGILEHRGRGQYYLVPGELNMSLRDYS